MVALVLASREWAGWAVAQVITLVAVGFIPVAIGVAILRYRLFDIDRLISRTLVYGLLTAVLAGVYATGVFAAGRLLDPAQGRSGLAVAASTLAVAALFQPLRRRIQNLVDGASIGPATTRAGPWRRSALGSARRSTWTASRPSCSPSSTRRCSLRRRRCGFGPLAPGRLFNREVNRGNVASRGSSSLRCGPDVDQMWTRDEASAVGWMGRRSDLLDWLVGLPGFEPGTSS